LCKWLKRRVDARRDDGERVIFGRHGIEGLSSAKFERQGCFHCQSRQGPGRTGLKARHSPRAVDRLAIAGDNSPSALRFPMAPISEEGE